jgi:hypothetical protein
VRAPEQILSDLGRDFVQQRSHTIRRYALSDLVPH